MKGFHKANEVLKLKSLNKQNFAKDHNQSNDSSDPGSSLLKQSLQQKIEEELDQQYNEKNIKEQMKLDNYRIHLFNKQEDIMKMSEQLETGFKRIQQHQRDLSNTNDENIKRKKTIELNKWMEELQQDFGYKDQHAGVKPNLLKLAEDKYGVRLSIQYRNALEGRSNEEGIPIVLIEDNKLESPTSKIKQRMQPLKKIPLTSEVKFSPQHDLRRKQAEVKYRRRNKTIKTESGTNLQQQSKIKTQNRDQRSGLSTPAIKESANTLGMADFQSELQTLFQKASNNGASSSRQMLHGKSAQQQNPTSSDDYMIQKPDSQQLMVRQHLKDMAFVRDDHFSEEQKAEISIRDQAQALPKIIGQGAIAQGSKQNSDLWTSQEEHVFLKQIANRRRGGHSTKNKHQPASFERDYGSLNNNTKEILPTQFKRGMKKLRIQQPPSISSQPSKNQPTSRIRPEITVSNAKEGQQPENSIYITSGSLALAVGTTAELKNLMTQEERSKAILEKARLAKIRNAKARKKQMKQLDQENKQILRGYAKTANVVTKFAKELLDSDLEDEELSQDENKQNNSRNAQLTSEVSLLHPSPLNIHLRNKLYSSVDASNRDGRSVISGIGNRQNMASKFMLSNGPVVDSQMISDMNMPSSVMNSKVSKKMDDMKRRNDTMKLKSRYESEFRKKLAQSNQQVKTKRTGGHVEMIQPVTVKNKIPFLTSESKAESLYKYLEANEPRLLVPQSYLDINTASTVTLPPQSNFQGSVKSNKFAHQRYLHNKPSNDRYKNNNESQRSMDYTSIESEENNSVIKYNTIETLNSLEGKYVKPDTAENLEKGEAYIGQTPQQVSSKSLLKNAESLRGLCASQDLKKQPSFQVSPIQMLNQVEKVKKLDNPSYDLQSSIQNTESAKQPGQLMYNQSILSIQRVSTDGGKVLEYADGRGSSLSLVKGQRPRNYVQQKNQRIVPHSHRLFNVSSVASSAFVKASNVLQTPFSLNERQTDAKAEKKLRMPTNPIDFKHNFKPLIKFTVFCKSRNIPFNENEQRFFVLKQQEHQKISYNQACTYFLHQIALDKESELERLAKIDQLKADYDMIQRAQEAVQQEKYEQQKEKEERAAALQLQVNSDKQAEQFQKKLTFVKPQEKAPALPVSMKSKFSMAPPLTKKITLQVPQKGSNQASRKSLDSQQNHRPSIHSNSKENILKDQPSRKSLADSQKDSQDSRASFFEKQREKELKLKEIKLQQREREIVKNQKELEERDNRHKLIKQETMQNVIDKIHHIVDNPVSLNTLNKKKLKGGKVKLSTLAKKNPNFSLVAFTKIHRMEMNERLLQTLERNDIERPKVMQEKFQILKQFEPEIENIAGVKSAVRQEMKKKMKTRYERFKNGRIVYQELLEFIHTRYSPDRADCKERAIVVQPYDKKLIRENNLTRVPVELERRFMEILYLILEDGWNLPEGQQWIEVLDFLDAFNSQSQLLQQDNPLKDCFSFFLLASQLYGFEKEFTQKYHSMIDQEQKYGSQGGSTLKVMPSNMETQRSALDPQSALSLAGLPEVTQMINVANVDKSQEPTNTRPQPNDYASEHPTQGKSKAESYSDKYGQESEQRSRSLSVSLRDLAKHAARRENHGLDWQDNY